MAPVMVPCRQLALGLRIGGAGDCASDTRSLRPVAPGNLCWRRWRLYYRYGDEEWRWCQPSSHHLLLFVETWMKPASTWEVVAKYLSCFSLLSVGQVPLMGDLGVRVMLPLYYSRLWDL